MKILVPVKKYYTEKIQNFGPTPLGVDWNSEHGQIKRFEALSKVISHSSGTPFSINDYGCGYGAFYGYLFGCGWRPNYLGIDISRTMVAEGRKKYKEALFRLGSHSKRFADYSVASGLFNVALNLNREQWLRYILKTLKNINSSTKIGFSFNILSSFSDIKHRKSHLFYANPTFFLIIVKKIFLPK